MPTRLNVSIYAFVLCSVSLAHADEAAKIAKIEQIFTLSRIDKVLGQSLSMIGNQMKSAALQRTFHGPLSPAQQKLANEFQDKLNQVLAPVITWDNLKPIYVNLYAKNFTEPEIDGILAFYKSSAGQAMVTKSPQLMSEANQTVRQRVVAVQPKVQVLMKEYMEKSKGTQVNKQ